MDGLESVTTNARERLSEAYPSLEPEILNNLIAVPTGNGSDDFTRLSPVTHLATPSSMTTPEFLDSSVATPSTGNFTDTPVEESPFDNFKALSKRLSIPPQISIDFGFCPDIRLTPFLISSGVYKVLESNPQLRDPNIRRGFTLVSHGLWSHTWSMMPDMFTGTKVIRPLATYQTPTYHIGQGFASIHDLKSFESIKLALFDDTYTSGHLEFMVCDDYLYEWRQISPTKEECGYYLWQHRIVDGIKRPAALLRPTSGSFKSPVDNKPLWSVEIDIDKIDSETAFLSAFCLMQHRALLAIHSYFAIAKQGVQPPQSLVNVIFEGESRVFQRGSKFFSTWEEDSPEPVKDPLSIKVFDPSYLDQFKIPDAVLEALNQEAIEYVTEIKRGLGLLI